MPDRIDPDELLRRMHPAGLPPARAAARAADEQHRATGASREPFPLLTADILPCVSMRAFWTTSLVIVLLGCGLIWYLKGEQATATRTVFYVSCVSSGIHYKTQRMIAQVEYIRATGGRTLPEPKSIDCLEETNRAFARGLPARQPERTDLEELNATAAFRCLPLDTYRLRSGSMLGRGAILASHGRERGIGVMGRALKGVVVSLFLS